MNLLQSIAESSTATASYINASNIDLENENINKNDIENVPVEPENSEPKPKAEDENFARSVSTQQVPYILNGELYEIQKKEGENVTVKCIHCPPDRVYRGSVRSTGNFHMHIKRRHPYLLEKLHEMKVHSLLERRDRFMKGRRIKSTFKSNPDIARVSNNINCQENAGVHNIEQKCAHIQNGEQEKAFLKIKRAFQRHQEEEAMRNGHHNGKPIDFSSNGGMSSQNSSGGSMDLRTLPSNLSVQTNDNSVLEDINVGAKVLSSESIYEAAIVATTPCPSEAGSYGGRITPTSQIDKDLIIKAEQGAFADQQPLDLSLNNMSSSFSETNASTTSSGTDSPVSSTLLFDKEFISHDNTLEQHLTIRPAVQLYENLLSKMENSLRQIGNEMQVRNQIERNRIFLEMTKFKYLHPDFKF